MNNELDLFSEGLESLQSLEAYMKKHLLDNLKSKGKEITLDNNINIRFVSEDLKELENMIRSFRISDLPQSAQTLRSRIAKLEEEAIITNWITND